MGPELRKLGTRLDLAMDRIDSNCAAIFSPERRAQLQAALATVKRALEERRGPSSAT